MKRLPFKLLIFKHVALLELFFGGELMKSRARHKSQGDSLHPWDKVEQQSEPARCFSTMNLPNQLPGCNIVDKVRGSDIKGVNFQSRVDAAA